jgi:two-component system nitrate/nitrite response regulator NarL
MATIAIATRHEIAGAGIEAVLQTAGYRVVARCSHADHLVRPLEAYCPDIIILAENVIGDECTEAVLRLRAHRNCPVRIILLLEKCGAINPMHLLDLHVEGIVLSASCAKNLIECVASVHQGRKWIDPELLRQLTWVERAGACDLTSREADIAHHVSQGLSNKQIARELHLSEGTVKMYLHHIYGKFHLSGRTQLALWLTKAEAKPQMAASGNGARQSGGYCSRNGSRRA